MNPTLKGKGFVAPHMYEGFDEAVFEKWYNRWKPDALLASGDSSGKVKDWIKSKGLGIGEDIAIAELNLMQTDGSLAGVSQRAELIGKSAANVVDSLLNHFEYGIPDTPLRTLIEGVWIDGSTAPRKG